jgi:hypothetical protein
MKPEENVICEAIDTYLQDKAQLGVPEPPSDKKDEDSHSFQFLHEHINELFATKAADLTHYDGACAAFRKVHNYKYVTDPTFHGAVKKEMSAQAIPESEQKKALDLIPKIIEEVSDDKDAWSEQDAGFHPNLNEVMETSTKFNKD